MISPHIIEVALLILAAYLIGCVIGAVARGLFSPRRAPMDREDRVSPMTQAAISAAAAGAAAAAGQSTMAQAARDPGEEMPPPVEPKPMPLAPEPPPPGQEPMPRVPGTMPAAPADEDLPMEEEEELPPVPDTPDPTERP